MTPVSLLPPQEPDMQPCQEIAYLTTFPQILLTWITAWFIPASATSFYSNTNLLWGFPCKNSRYSEVFTVSRIIAILLFLYLLKCFLTKLILALIIIMLYIPIIYLFCFSTKLEHNSMMTGFVFCVISKVFF
jgi:fatty acid desaturase